MADTYTSPTHPAHGYVPVPDPTTTCTWCEEGEAVEHGTDEHNGAWSLCADCRDDA